MKRILIIVMIAFTSVSFAEPDSGAVIDSSEDVAAEVLAEIQEDRTHLNRRGSKYSSQVDFITDEERAKMKATKSLVLKCLNEKKDEQGEKFFDDNSTFCKEFRLQRDEKTHKYLEYLRENRVKILEFIDDSALNIKQIN